MKAHQKAVGKLIRIGDDAAENIAHGMCVKVGDGQRLQLVIGVFAQRLHHGEANAIVNQADAPLQHAAAGDQGDAKGKKTP